MDYYQFLFMPQEIGLLFVFLLVFIYDTFMPARMGKHLPMFTTILTALLNSRSHLYKKDVQRPA